MSPSTQEIKISDTPRFFISVSTFNQNLALSFSLIQIPNNSFAPSVLTPSAVSVRAIPSYQSKKFPA